MEDVNRGGNYMSHRGAVPWIIGVVLSAAIFQLFFRYEYIHTMGNWVIRVDRLTGATCYLPCAKPVVETRVAIGCPSFKVVSTFEGDYPKEAPAPAVIVHMPPKGYELQTVFVELDDGHVYSLVDLDKEEQVKQLKTGETVTLCSATSRIDGKTYYSLDSETVFRTNKKILPAF